MTARGECGEAPPRSEAFHGEISLDDALRERRDG